MSCEQINRICEGKKISLRNTGTNQKPSAIKEIRNFELKVNRIQRNTTQECSSFVGTPLRKQNPGSNLLRKCHHHHHYHHVFAERHLRTLDYVSK
jgi:hypothetical protein